MSTSNELVLMNATGNPPHALSSTPANYSKTVIAVARTAKVQVVRDIQGVLDDRLEVAAIDDITAGDFTTALKDVTAVIHTASPLVGRAEARAVLDGAIRGTRNVLEQALEAGIKKLVFTSSSTAVSHPAKPKFAPEVYTENDWNDTTEAEALASDNPFFVYSASKGIAERALWDLVSAYPDADVTTLVLPFLLGPFLPAFPIKAGDTSALGSNGLVYGFLNGSPATLGVQAVDAISIHQAARAHVLALRAPRASEVGRKRLLLQGGQFDWAQVAEHLRAVRPVVAARLPVFDDTRKEPRHDQLDVRRGREVLGIEDLDGWKAFLEETVDDLLRLEEEWKKAGWTPSPNGSQ